MMAGAERDGPVPADAAPRSLRTAGHVDGLRWHGGHWWWTDPDGAALHLWDGLRLDEHSKPLRCRLPDRVAGFAFCRSGRVLLGLAKWLCFVDPAPPPAAGLGRRAPQPGVAVDPAEPRTSISDGATDRHGNFVFGTRNVTAEARQIGSYYQYSQAQGLRRLALPAASAAYSIAFSVDGRTMYFSDAATRQIMQCDYDPDTARVDNVRLFADVPDAQPRGAVLDEEGCLWSAQGGAARVVRYAPDGAVLRSVALPVAHPTRPAFGGPLLDRLMVGAMPQPGATGGVHLLDAAGVRGLRDVLFDDGPSATAAIASANRRRPK
ncbi:SMP-30/gluconolactonase/LRE family protein [Pseudoduganella namucuonensis]|uniref:L-arabinonolactonase n=1 Tax=Pseudoduganella namucuonensis TaxID=1035707 RepID=A0A1I7G9D6_9BURK|nr:SMP-30/gluconolactonase/LRE family protein [Pseudoduganella namucuonensis]SFU45070.1 L-arabinonolactonase [Pseudoduganella namucuonensis]